MAISFVAVASNLGAAAPTSVTTPTGFAAGDLLLVLINVDGSTASTPTMSGFTQRENDAIVAPDSTEAFFLWKIATGTEGASIALAWGGGTPANDTAVFCAAYRGVDNVTPFDVADAKTLQTTAVASGGAATVTGLTTVTNNAWVVMMTALDPTNQPTALTKSYSAGFNDRGAFGPGGTGWAWDLLGDKVITTAGATGTFTLTITPTPAATWGGIIYVAALRPSGASTPAFEDDTYQPPIRPTDNPVGVYIG